MPEAKIKCVAGNVLRVAVPLTQRVTTLQDGSVVTTDEPFYPVGKVDVRLLAAGFKSYAMDNKVEGSLLTFKDMGTLPPALYGLQIDCKDADGEPCRFYMDGAVHIVNATEDAGIEAGVEFDAETQTLDGALFIFAKGDKGDDGVGIESVTYKMSTDAGNVYTITLTDGAKYDITAPRGPRGADGEPGAPGSPGTPGRDGKDGKDGINGKDGTDGVGISSITFKEETVDGDVYTITLTNGNAYDFTAPRGPQGTPGVTPDLSNYIQKSQTAGLVKNDGTIDTNTYLTSAPVTSVNGQTGAVILSIPDVSTKEDKVDIVSASGTTLTAEVDKYYTLSSVGTLAITLPTIAAGTTKVQTVTFYIAAGSTPAVTFTSTHSIYYSDGFEIAASSTYEVSAAYNGIAWVVASVKIVIPT